jgi:hypothetical protein
MKSLTQSEIPDASTETKLEMAVSARSQPLSLGAETRLGEVAQQNTEALDRLLNSRRRLTPCSGSLPRP